MDNNQRFLNEYNRLDNYLHRITGADTHINLISYLERVLPEKEQSELKTIREFKNVIESHGVNPKYKKPAVPAEWIVWLLDMLDYCKTNKEIIATRIKKQLNQKEATKSRPQREAKRVTKCDFCPYHDGKKCTNYGYFYGGKEVFSVSAYGKLYTTYRKKPCPSEVLEQYSNYINKNK